MGITTTYDTFPSTVAPQFDYVTEDLQRSIVTEMESGVEERNSIWRFSKRSFSLAYRYLSATDRKTLHDFFKNQRGAWKPFWFKDFELRDWEDEYVGYGGPLDIGGALSYDAQFVEYTDETDEATDSDTGDITLLETPRLNEAYYFGHKAQFDKLHLMMETAGVGTWTVTWEYWNGAWTALAGVTDETNGFTAGAPGGDYLDLFDGLDWDSEEEYEADIMENIRLAFEMNVSFTIPNDWAVYELEDRYLYWIRARVSSFTSYTVAPTGTQARVSSKTFELHSHTTTSGSLLVYVDGTPTTDYTFVSGGGAAGRDRITFDDYPALGALITADYPGYMCCFARFTTDTFRESIPFNDLFNIEFNLQEVFE